MSEYEIIEKLKKLVREQRFIRWTPDKRFYVILYPTSTEMDEFLTALMHILECS